MNPQTPLTKEIIGDCAIITFDTPKSPVNLLDSAMLLALETEIMALEEDTLLKAIIFLSAKDNNFIAGADITELTTAKKEETTAVLKRVQAIFSTIEHSKKIYIAGIHGACLGGGLELALSCHFRIASRDAYFSAPEVNLGFFPAAGGTQRLPRLVGLKKALEMLLTGKLTSSREAEKIGLIDWRVNQKEELRPSLLKFAEKTQSSKKRNYHRLTRLSLLTLWIAQKKLEKKTFSLYPAPFAILSAIKVGITQGFEAGLNFEATNFYKLAHSQVSKNLVRLFFLQKEHQKNPYKAPLSPAEHLSVVGSGLMGSGITYVSMLNGFRVSLSDNRKDALSHAETFIFNELQKRLKKELLTDLEYRRCFSRLAIDLDYEHIGRSDAVIEAIVEDLAIKRELLKKLEPLLNKDTIVATNTSSLPLVEIGKDSGIKDRLVGMHYFSPVQKMPLLEIIKTPHTSAETLAKACDIGLRQKKTLIVVNDSPGFYTTRVISALFDEAFILALEGVPISKIDGRLKSIGFQMGPMELLDEIGLDVALHVSKILKDHFGSRLIAADFTLTDKMIEHGLLGQKTGQGFYCYKDHKKSKNSNFEKLLKPLIHQENIREEAIENRILWRMVNEAAFCLSEEVVANEEDADVGAVFGIGFPPYLGGPFAYLHSYGIKKFAKELDRLASSCGPRFKKAPYFSSTL